MHSDWFNGIVILQGRWRRGEKVGYCYPSGLEKTLCKWDVYDPLFTKGLTNTASFFLTTARKDKVLPLYDPTHILFIITEMSVHVNSSKY
jgi:hypothetical protein